MCVHGATKALRQTVDGRTVRHSLARPDVVIHKALDIRHASAPLQLQESNSPPRPNRIRTVPD